MFEQYWRIKSQVSDAILFYRMGDFYELFGDDAVVAAPLLGVQLTSRNKDSEIPVPMAGVPVHALTNYSRKLVEAGYRVALGEQVAGDSTGAKLMERKIVRILTPGLPIDLESCADRSGHYLVAVSHDGASQQSFRLKTRFELNCIDLLRGKIWTGYIIGVESFRELICLLDPKEILLDGHLKDRWADDMRGVFSFLRKTALTFRQGNERSDNRFNVDEIFWSYLEETQCLSREELKPRLEMLSIEQLSQCGRDHAHLPATTREHWSIFPELFQGLDRCGSAIGSRALREILERPLQNVDRIRVRQEFIQSVQTRSGELAQHCREIYDVERILGRFQLGVALPHELLRLRRSLQAMAAVIAEVWSWPSFQTLRKSEGFLLDAADRDQLISLSEHLAHALRDFEDGRSPQAKSDVLHQFIAPGFHADLDRLRQTFLEQEDWLRNYEDTLRNQYGIGTLKVRSNSVFGFYIEVSKAQAKNLPEFFERKQTLVNAERFSSPELRSREQEILSAEQRLQALARDVLAQLQRDVLAVHRQLRSVIEVVAFVDAIQGAAQSIARWQRFGPWVLPDLIPGKPFFVSLQQSRHPLVEEEFGEFVPNDFSIGHGQSTQLLLLTGPNMSGKSTLMRQVGLAIFLAQCGLPVPAQKMTLAPCDGFFSRMGASDRIFQGESTFMVEMKETAEILSSAGHNSLVIIDEVGRGTSTEDGLAIAEALLEYLATQVQAPAIFATHFHELTDAVARLPSVSNGSIEIKEWKGQLLFLRKLLDQPAASSYGIAVAKLAGIPAQIVARAEELFLNRAKQVCTEPQLSLALTSAHEQARDRELGSEWESFVDDIGSCDLDLMSPRDAWSHLDLLQKRARVLRSRTENS